MLAKAPKHNRKEGAILRDRAYLDHLRTQPCILSGIWPSEYETVDPAHLGTAGKGIKSPDDEALPILHKIHANMHQRGEMTVIKEWLPDWLLREALRAYARAEYRKWKDGR